MGHESRNFTAYHEGGKAPSAGGVGWAQWTGPRRHAFERWVAAHGLNPTSDEASWRFLTEGDPQTAAAIARVKRTSNAHDAMKAFHDSFEISADTDPKTGRVRNWRNWNSRLQLTDRALRMSTVNGVAQGPSDTNGGMVANGGGPRVYFGDSIAEGFRQADHAGGDTKVGRNPSQVLAAINRAKNLAGRAVTLSSGVSNDIRGIGIVSKEIDALIGKGVSANQIRLLGVGNRRDFAGLNEKLAEIARSKGVQFAGPIGDGNVASDHVHFRNYRANLGYAKGYENQGPVVPPVIAERARRMGEDRRAGREHRERIAQAGTVVHNHNMFNVHGGDPRQVADAVHSKLNSAVKNHLSDGAYA